jgi:8-oxo-dGTP pyrophosphatase MutT (NUDIX family)
MQINNSMKEEIFHLGVKALIRNKVGEILILQVNPAKLKPGGGWSGGAYFDVPGGRVKKGSQIEETLFAEIEEETGIRSVDSLELISTVLSNLRIPVDGGEVGLILSVYLCRVDEESLKDIRLSDEHIEYKWVEPKEASRLLRDKYPRTFTEKVATL